MNIGLYIHIPFCRIKCDYCSFYSVPLSRIDDGHKEDFIEKYLTALINEIHLRADELRDFEVDTIYFGGGTPSLLLPSQLDRLLNRLYKKLHISRECDEITIECNPGNFSTGLIEDYKTLNINRVVLGVQTMNEKFHKLIGRAGPLCSTTMLKNFADIPDIIHCTDVIFGIPGQTWEMLYADLDKITGFQFEHISAYALTIELNTPIYARKNHLPDVDTTYRNNFEKTIGFLTDRGYLHYEVSNYAFPDYESKHNLKYWKFLPYFGFGAGAHSFYNNERYYNNNSVGEYIKNNGDIRQKDTRTADSMLVEYLLSGMRLSEGISLNDMEKKTQRKIPIEMMKKINRMKKDRLLIIEEKGEDLIIKFTRDGFFRMDTLIYKLTEMYL